MRKTVLPLLLCLALLAACGAPAGLTLAAAQPAEQNGVRLTVTDYRDGVLTVCLENGGAAPWNCCLGCRVQRWQDGAWQDLPWPEGGEPEEVCFFLRPGMTGEQSLDLTALALGAGEYRFCLGGLEAPFILR